MAISLEQAAAQLSRLKSRLPLLVGAEIIDFVLDNFDKQGFDQGGRADKWAPRKDGSRAGGAILVGKQSGRLRRSVRQLRADATSVTIGSDLPYAGIHNTGGKIVVPITAKSRRFFWAMWYTTGDAKWKGAALTKKTVMLVNMPKRQYIGDSKALQERIVRVVERELGAAFN